LKQCLRQSVLSAAIPITSNHNRYLSTSNNHHVRFFQKLFLCEIWTIYNQSEGVLFLPRDASAERGDATVSRLSVCPSVRL